MINVVKRILFGAIILCSVSVAKSQTFSFDGGSNQSFYPKATGYMDCAIHIKNEGMENLILKYQKVSVDFPSKWDFSFCDNVNCITFFADTGTFAAIIPGNNESSMKVTVYPNGFADTAIVKYAFWDVKNPSKIDTLTFNINVRWGVGVSELVQNTTVYPNPSTGIISAKTNSEIISAILLDAAGKQVDVQSIIQGSNVTILPSNIVNGVYFLQLKTALGENISRVMIQK